MSPRIEHVRALDCLSLTRARVPDPPPPRRSRFPPGPRERRRLDFSSRSSVAVKLTLPPFNTPSLAPQSKLASMVELELANVVRPARAPPPRSLPASPHLAPHGPVIL